MVVVNSWLLWARNDRDLAPGLIRHANCRSLVNFIPRTLAGDLSRVRHGLDRLTFLLPGMPEALSVQSKAICHATRTILRK